MSNSQGSSKQSSNGQPKSKSKHKSLLSIITLGLAPKVRFMNKAENRQEVSDLEQAKLNRQTEEEIKWLKFFKDNINFVNLTIEMPDKDLKLQLVAACFTFQAIRFMRQNGKTDPNLNFHELEEKVERLQKIIEDKVIKFGYDIKALLADTDSEEIKRKMMMFNPTGIKLALNLLEQFREQKRQLTDRSSNETAKEPAKEAKDHPICHIHYMTLDKCIYNHDDEDQTKFMQQFKTDKTDKSEQALVPASKHPATGRNRLLGNEIQHDNGVSSCQLLIQSIQNEADGTQKLMAARVCLCSITNRDLYVSNFVSPDTPMSIELEHVSYVGIVEGSNESIYIMLKLDSGQSMLMSHQNINATMAWFQLLKDGQQQATAGKSNNKSQVIAEQLESMHLSDRGSNHGSETGSSSNHNQQSRSSQQIQRDPQNISSQQTQRNQQQSPALINFKLELLQIGWIVYLNLPSGQFQKAKISEINAEDSTVMLTWSDNDGTHNEIVSLNKLLRENGWLSNLIRRASALTPTTTFV